MTKLNQRVSKDPLDRYYTPAWVTEILVENWPFPDSVWGVWEPCAGEGAIAEVLRSIVLDVWETDVYTNDGCAAYFDFLHDDIACVKSRSAEDFGDSLSGEEVGGITVAIVTNPPYSIPNANAADFVRKALEYTPYVAMLMRLSWLEECEDRKSIFAEQPPAEVWVLPSVKIEGPNTNGGSPLSTSAWFIWKPGTTKTKLMWVEAKP